MTIKLPADLEMRVKGEATRRGLAPEEFVTQLISAQLAGPGVANPNRATLDLLAKWDEEDETTDPREIARRQKQWEDFRQSMNDHSLTGRPVYP